MERMFWQAIFWETISIYIYFENFEIIAVHRKSSQIITDHRNPTFGKEFWDHRRSSAKVLDHRQSSAEGGGILVGAFQHNQ
jgi:hypothetical protein